MTLATRLFKGESVPALMLIDTRLVTAATVNCGSVPLMVTDEQM